jgi:hypothetical protein
MYNHFVDKESRKCRRWKDCTKSYVSHTDFLSHQSSQGNPNPNPVWVYVLYGISRMIHTSCAKTGYDQSWTRRCSIWQANNGIDLLSRLRTPSPQCVHCHWNSHKEKLKANWFHISLEDCDASPHQPDSSRHERTGWSKCCPHDQLVFTHSNNWFAGVSIMWPAAGSWG